MVKYLMDAGAWIEYLLGSPKGKEVRRLIQNSDVVITAHSTIGEVYGWCFKSGYSFATAVRAINNLSTIHNTSLNIWVEGSNHCKRLRDKRPKFGIIDGILLAIQNITGSVIVTSDTDFKGLPGVVVL
ncbi:MAG: PIN domain-containing protein [Candidatus Woesearchaeota archaeon]